MSFELVAPRGPERARQSYQSPTPTIRLETAVPFDASALRFHYQQSRAPRFAPIGDHHTDADRALTSNDTERAENDARTARKFFEAVVLAAIVVLWVMLLALLLVAYYQFTGNLRTAHAALLPYIGELANHTLSTLTHADETATMASDMMADGKLLSSSALPAMLDALNKSQHMVERLERIAAHPTVKVSLGDD